MSTRNRWIGVAAAAGLLAAVLHAEVPRPNILWITIEDWSPDLSCYGTPAIRTPHIDKLAAEGVRYTHAFVTGPVCSPSRSAMMTGFHQNYIGASQHRTRDKKPLPHGIRPIPHLLRDAGYFTCLMSGKIDCNFVPNRRQDLFMGKDWKEREPGQPFFARITFSGTHRAWQRDPRLPIDADAVKLPPYYPDVPLARRDWANGLEQMQLVDRQVGQLLQRLDDEGLRDRTLVFFISDHGRCHIRGKQFLYDGGIRIPMIVRWPGHIPPNRVDDSMVMSIDICATVLEVAGVTSPVPLHGHSLFGDEVKNRRYVFAARDKMDDTHDAMRMIRSRKHKLIHNLMPERAWCQYNEYKERQYPMLALMNVMNLRGELTPEQARFMAPTKPEFELFDLRKDPHEVHNVADDPAYAEVKARLLSELQAWRTAVEDQGVSDTFRTGGWDATYPTRTLTEWEAVLAQWEPWVFRAADAKMTHPFRKQPQKKKPSTGQPRQISR